MKSDKEKANKARKRKQLSDERVMAAARKVMRENKDVLKRLAE